MQPAPAPPRPRPPNHPSPSQHPRRPATKYPTGGQWQVVFTADDGETFAHALDITIAYDDDQQAGGYGSQQLCAGQGANPCDEKSDDDTGVAFIGTITREDGTAPLSLVIYDKNGRKVYTTESLSTGTDAQGRQLLTGAAVWLQGGSFSNSMTGTITATNVSALQTPEPTLDGTLTGSWSGTTTLLLGTVQTDFLLTQNSNQISGEIFIFPQPGDELSTTLEGAVTSRVVTLIVEIPVDGQDLTFVYQGTLSGTTFAGQVTVQPADGSGDSERGTFTVSKSAQQ